MSTVTMSTIVNGPKKYFQVLLIDDCLFSILIHTLIAMQEEKKLHFLQFLILFF